jgi:Stress responsive A/B Barrel Domain
MKKLILTLVAAALFSFGAARSFAQSASAPKTVLHVVTVQWKADATPEKIQAALDGAQKLPDSYKGILHVWTKTLKTQSNRTHVIAMEFASEQALKDYADSAAQKEWYKVYQPVREGSTTFDVTN